MVSFMLKLAFCLLSRKHKILIYDEALAPVAEVYLPAFSELVRGLAKEFGVTIVAVTHSVTLAEMADRHYVVNREFDQSGSAYSTYKFQGESK